MRTILLVPLLFMATMAKNAVQLQPPEKLYKILMLLPLSSTSHRNVFIPIANELADRGHKVVMLTPLDPVSKKANIYEIKHSVEVFDPSTANMFEVRENDSSGGFAECEEMLPKLARGLYHEAEVKKLYEKRDEFDIILVDSLFNEAAYPFLYKKPFIFVSTSGKLPTISTANGNVFNPSYMPFFTEYSRPYSFIDRVNNLAAYISFLFFWHRSVMPAIQVEIDKHFPKLPPLVELEKNSSLTLMNTHFTLDISSPNLPSEIEVGAMHCRPAKPLPDDLQKWIDGAGSDGVVYFSLGSITRGNSMPDKYRNMFVNAFSRIKQRVIWKFESDIPNLPKNVLKNSWFSQQDILAHPNVKLFISHGGMLSYQESVYHKTPLIVLPIYGDQPRNGQLVKNNGHGLNLVWEEVTEDDIVEAIEDIVYNSKYHKNIEAASNVLKDQVLSPQELAVWWIEYVIRHRGAPALRSPAADISWIDYFMLDVILILHLIMFVLYKFIFKIGSYLLRSKPKPSRNSNKLKLN